MKKYALICLSVVSFLGTSQVKVPQLSPLKKMEQVVGLTKITIEYSRPSKRERELFGTLVPYGKIWRTGANANTKISFSDDVEIQGKNLKSGTYALYSKPSENNWEIYFYSDTNNWGNPKQWDESKIVLSTNAKVYKNENDTESFLIDINNIGVDKASLVLAWGKTKIMLPFTVPTDKKVMQTIEDIMGSENISEDDYTNAASYYYESDKDIEKAKEWIDKAIEMGGSEKYWVLWTQANIYIKVGKTKVAKKIIEKAIGQAKDAGSTQAAEMMEDVKNDL